MILVFNTIFFVLKIIFKLINLLKYSQKFKILMKPIG